MRKIISICSILILGLFLSSTALAHSHGHHEEDQEHKKGILLVTFGSSYPQAQAAFENIEDQVKQAFPDTPVHWAYTSHMVRAKLAEEGQELDSPAQALANMQDQGFTHVAVQSLHTIPGAEFHDLHEVVQAFRSMPGDLEHIQLGYPLLGSDQDLREVSQALLQNIPDERGSQEAVVFVGHGSYHPSNAFYKALAYQLQQEDPLAYVGTVGGSPSIEDIQAQLENEDVQKAYLMPFMSVAGDHAQNDIAGEGQDSWKSILSQAGIECETVMKGSAEYDNIVDVWIRHLEEAYSELEH
ncbi:MAG: sirohydrochlorin cobaltochelatase [Thermodesulfobacteriota bacterium]